MLLHFTKYFLFSPIYYKVLHVSALSVGHYYAMQYIKHKYVHREILLYGDDYNVCVKCMEIWGFVTMYCGNELPKDFMYCIA